MKKSLLGLAIVSALLPVWGANIRNGNFEKSLKPWHGCYGNKGKFELSPIAHSGKQSLKLSAQNAGEVRIFNRGNYVPSFFGQRWRVSFWVKGQGEFSFGAHEHGSPTDKLGLYHIGYYWHHPVKLTGQWQKHQLFYTGQGGDLTSFLPMFRLQGKQSVAYLDDITLEPAPEPGWQLQATPRNVVATPGATIRVEFQVRHHSQLVAGEQVLIKGSKIWGKEIKVLHSDTQGKVKLQFTLPANLKTSVQMFGVGLPQRGVGQLVYIDIVPPELFAKLDQLSAQMANPGKVLIIGDSLSDYLRGYNYADTLEYFLNRHHPGQAQWINYAIRGDKIPRTLGRFMKRKEWSWERYAGIWQVKPQLVIIFLGHNDSLLLNRAQGAQSPTQVPPAQFQRQMLELIKQVRICYHNPKVVLLTPVQPDYAKSSANCARYKLKVAFGEPSIMLKYRQLVEEIGRAAHCQVIDLHTPTASYPKRDLIFNSDGIHVNALGNKIIAETIMRELQ